MLHKEKIKIGDEELEIGLNMTGESSQDGQMSKEQLSKILQDVGKLKLESGTEIKFVRTKTDQMWNFLKKTFIAAIIMVVLAWLVYVASQPCSFNLVF